MSDPLGEQHLSKRRRINSAQRSEPAKQLNAEAISHERKDSALDIKVLPSSTNTPAVAAPAPTTAPTRMKNHKFRPVPKSDPDRPITPKINPFDALITYPERLNFTQKLLEQALKTARAEVEERKKVNKDLKKERDEAKKEAVEVKRQLVEFMAQQTVRDGDHAALVKATAVSQDGGRAF